MDNPIIQQVQNMAIRYIVDDVDASVNFYSTLLGFHVNQHVKSAFASLSLGNLQLFINQPGAGGAGHAMPDGTMPAPGGWNRFQLQVKNIEAVIESLTKKGAQFRSDLIAGVGGKQILLEDPSGNLVELFEFSS
jgi:catechol 2,3-dioxygenase-like lactoylglutathione lyase family enzyme